MTATTAPRASASAGLPTVPPARVRAAPLALALAVVLAAICLGSALLDARGSDAARASLGMGHGLSSALIGAAVGLCGVVVLAFRPRHAIGWVVTGTGLLWSFDGLCESYAVYGLGERDLPLAGLALWVVAELGAVLLSALPLVLVLYPPGRLPEGRWRPVAVGVVVAAFVLPLVLVLAPDSVVYGDTLPAAAREALPGFGLPLPDPVAVVLLRVAQVTTLLAMPLSAAVLFARQARAEGVERTQLRWLLWAALVCLLAGGSPCSTSTAPSASPPSSPRSWSRAPPS